MTTRDIDHLIKLASENIDKGVIEEPRYWWDSITLLSDSRVSKGDPNAFINGEEFPVRITQVAFALRPNAAFTSGIEERLLQRCAVRMIWHDQYYMARLPAPVPLWGNKVTASPYALGRGFASTQFDRPVILSARDSLRFRVAIEGTMPQGAQYLLVQAGVHGVGLQSKRPYFLHSYQTVSATQVSNLPTADFRNDGAEPIALSEMSISCAFDNDGDGGGDIRRVRVNISQLGNGTGREWMSTPLIGSPSPAPLGQMPASLLGLTEGRCVVHQLPGDGIIFEPGEGITLEGFSLDTSADGLDLMVGLSGWVALV